MTRFTSKIFKAMAPTLFGLAALALMISFPVAGRTAEPGMGNQVQGWYDPQGWFERGGGIDHERDWYNYSYDYGQRGLYGYYEPSPGQPSGYYEPQEGGALNSPMFHRRGMREHFYTRDWYDREGAFERWL